MNYLWKLFNVDHESNIVLETINTKANDKIKYVRNIIVGKIKDALRKMKRCRPSLDCLIGLRSKKKAR